MILAAIAIALITLHMVDGRIVQLNPQAITQVIHAHTLNPNNMLVDSVNCVVRLTDGSFVSVSETCDAVQRLIEAPK